MSHEASFFYLKLFSNIIMGSTMGIAFPYALINTARTVRYMQGPSSKTLVHVMAWWLGLLGLIFLFDIINEQLVPTNSEVFEIYVRVTAAVFTISLGICCWGQRHALRSLYPKEEFIFEQEKRLKLLGKLQVCDATMPMARFETKEGIIIAANPWAQQMLGYNVLEMHKLEPGALVHPDDRARVLTNILTHDNGPYECRIITKVGRVIHVEVRSTPTPGPEGIRVTFLSDVTNYVEERDRRIRDLRSQSSRQFLQTQQRALEEVLEGSTVAL